MGEVRPPAQNTGVGGWYGGARGYADHLVSLKRPLGEVSPPPQTTTGARQMGRRGTALCRSFGISFQIPGRGEPTRTTHHRGMRVVRRCKGFCRSSGVSLETPGRGEPSRTKIHRGMKMVRRCKGFSHCRPQCVGQASTFPHCDGGPSRP